MNENSALLHELVSQVGAALGGKKNDHALGLPRRRRVLLELLVLGPSVAALFVAIEHGNGMLCVHFDALFASANGSERHNGTTVCIVEFVGRWSTVRVLEPHT